MVVRLIDSQTSHTFHINDTMIHKLNHVLRDSLEIITDRSQEGSQYVRGFGGIGGMLRYLVDFQSLQCDDFDEEEYDLDDY